MTDHVTPEEARHWIVEPNDGDEWITYDAKLAEFLEENPNCEVSGPFVLAAQLEAARKQLWSDRGAWLDERLGDAERQRRGAAEKP